MLFFQMRHLQIRMDLKHLKTKNQKAATKHKTETDNLQVRTDACCVNSPRPGVVPGACLAHTLC